jgi:hypothetical protein
MEQKQTVDPMVAENLKTNEQLRAQYEAWCAANPAMPPYCHPTFDLWAAGYKEFSVIRTGRVHGLEPREQEYTLDSWKAWVNGSGAAVAACQDLVVGAVRTVWLHSRQPGTGKTGLAIATAREFALSGRGDVAVVRMPRLQLADQESRAALFEQIKYCKLLILDDFHRYGWGSSRAADLLHTILDMVYNRRVSVIVTANVSMDGLMSAIDEDFHAAIDRLRDGGCVVEALNGESKRI